MVFQDCPDHVALTEKLVLMDSRGQLVNVVPPDPLECLDHLD